jgi:glycosyltransferase involved in cell wall biosynthesis
MKHHMKFSVVIPAYNEVATIASVVGQVREHASSIIVVDDGSVDGTAQVLAGLPVQVIRNEANLGKAASLWRGARVAIEQGAEAIVTLDGDGQHPPHHIASLVTVAQRYPDSIVVAARLNRRDKAPPMRRFANKFADFWISWAAGQRMVDTQSGFRIYPAQAFDLVSPGPDRRTGFVLESEILIEASHAGIRTLQIPIETIYPEDRRASHYRPLEDTWAIVRMVGGKLLRRGMYIPGLLSALRSPAGIIAPARLESLRNDD